MQLGRFNIRPQKQNQFLLWNQRSRLIMLDIPSRLSDFTRPIKGIALGGHYFRCYLQAVGWVERTRNPSIKMVGFASLNPPDKGMQPLHRVVQPLVIERAAHGRELLAKSPGVRCGYVRL